MAEDGILEAGGSFLNIRPSIGLVSGLANYCPGAELAHQLLFVKKKKYH